MRHCFLNNPLFLKFCNFLIGSINFMSVIKSASQEPQQNGSFYTLCRNFAVQSSAHGLRRAATARSLYTRIFWVTVFILALICCTFHCSFLVKTFLSYPRMTITEEIHADEITFPSITVCNLNIFKKVSTFRIIYK